MEPGTILKFKDVQIGCIYRIVSKKEPLLRLFAVISSYQINKDNYTGGPIKTIISLCSVSEEKSVQELWPQLHSSIAGIEIFTNNIKMPSYYLEEEVIYIGKMFYMKESDLK